MKNLIFSLLLLIVLFSCKTAKETADIKPDLTGLVNEAPLTPAVETSSQNLTGDSLLAYLERTACYGTCPMYKFKIYNSGYALYEGKRFVDMLGSYEAHIAASVLEEIKTKAKAVNYFEFRDEYPKKASDFPATKTTIIIDGKRKDVMNGSGAPAALKDFEAYLDSVKDGAVWKQVH